MTYWLLLVPLLLVAVGVGFVFWPAGLIVGGVLSAAWLLWLDVGDGDGASD